MRPHSPWFRKQTQRYYVEIAFSPLVGLGHRVGGVARLLLTALFFKRLVAGFQGNTSLNTIKSIFQCRIADYDDIDE